MKTIIALGTSNFKLATFLIIRRMNVVYKSISDLTCENVKTLQTYAAFPLDLC